MPIPNLDELKKKQAAGLARVVDTGDGKSFAIVRRRFSVDDGTELDSEVMNVHIKEVNVAIDDAQAKLDALKELKALLKPKPA